MSAASSTGCGRPSPADSHQSDTGSFFFSLVFFCLGCPCKVRFQLFFPSQRSSKWILGRKVGENSESILKMLLSPRRCQGTTLMSTRVNMHNFYLNPRGALSSRADTLPEGPRCPLLPSQRSDPVSSEGSARAQLEVGRQLIIFPKTPCTPPGRKRPRRGLTNERHRPFYIKAGEARNPVVLTFHSSLINHKCSPKHLANR